MTCIDQNGHCVTTESVYLILEVLKRPNLMITIYAHVTKILFERPDEEPSGLLVLSSQEVVKEREGKGGR